MESKEDRGERLWEISMFFHWKQGISGRRRREWKWWFNTVSAVKSRLSPKRRRWRKASRPLMEKLPFHEDIIINEPIFKHDGGLRPPQSAHFSVWLESCVSVVLFSSAQQIPEHEILLLLAKRWGAGRQAPRSLQFNITSVNFKDCSH